MEFHDVSGDLCDESTLADAGLSKIVSSTQENYAIVVAADDIKILLVVLQGAIELFLTLTFLFRYQARTKTFIYMLRCLGVVSPW